MHEGRLIVSGTVDEVMQDNRKRRTIVYRTGSESNGDHAVFEQIVDEESIPRVVSELCGEGITDITITSANLEDLFVAAVGHEGKV